MRERESRLGPAMLIGVLIGLALAACACTDNRALTHCQRRSPPWATGECATKGMNL